jgi:peptide deformylase
MKQTELKIHIWPDKILKKRCKKVEVIDNRIKDLFEQMYSLMKREKGIGLAANQVGIDLSMVVVESEDRVFKIINPKIEKKEKKIKFREGCLSFPGIELEITRFYRVWVSGLDIEGKTLNLEAEGTLAVVFQHEIDHINGILFIDRIPWWKKIEIYPKLKELKRR